MKRLIFQIFIILVIIIGVKDLMAKQNPDMPIVLVSIKQINNDILEMLKDELKAIFNKEVVIGKNIALPDFGYNRKREQYDANAMLDYVIDTNKDINFERILAVSDCDLYVNELNFVFGIAKDRCSLISITRLRQQFYGLLKNQNLFYKRILKEAVHELGHTYGLGHCKNPSCVMYFSNNLLDTDRKTYQLCPICKELLK